MSKYVHGYSGRENKRLYDQAGTLTALLHEGTVYPKGSKVLEAGCGVGAQTVILAKNSPQASITSVDISRISLDKAKKLAGRNGIKNVRFETADIFNLSFEDDCFDHIFVCFVLEHLKEPVKALSNLKRVLKKGGSITVIEGDHETSLFWPYSDYAMKTIKCLIEVQKSLGGDSLIGRRLYPLFQEAGFNEIRVIPRPVYADEGRPGMVEGFTKKTYIAMVEGVKKQALDLDLIGEKDWDKGIKELKRSAKPGGIFYYTFFKGIAVK